LTLVEFTGFRGATRLHLAHVGGFIRIFATLRGRIACAVVLLVLTACALVAGLALNIAERELRTTVGTQQFNLLSSAAAYLDADIASKQVLLRTMADSLASTGTSSSDVQAVLEQYTTLRDEFANVIAFDEGGLLIADLRDRRHIRKQRFADRAYFKDTMRLREGVISEPFISKLSNKPVILITEPVYDRSGRIVRILGGSINLDQPMFFGQITRLRPGKSGYLFALTKRGMILQHPDKQRLLQNILTEPGAAVPSTVAAMGGWEGWTIGRTKNGTNAVIAYKHMSNTDWILGVVYPAAEAFHGIQRARETGWFYAGIVAVLAGFVGWYVTWALLGPLRALRAKVRAVESGEIDIDAFDLQRRDEIGSLGRAFYSLSAKRQAAEQQLADLARTDALTGLGNRRRLDDELTQAFDRARRLRCLLGLAFLDIDHFKSINDTLGHEAGDLVLKEFGRRLKGAMRATDQVYRLAGDEFVVVIEQLDSAAAADVVARKIVDIVRQPFLVNGRSLDVTTSAGVSLCHWEANDKDALMRDADSALYETKHRGRDGYTIAPFVRPD
jgi:diguanylate cyclase (GGDEF)-like protein